MAGQTSSRRIAIALILAAGLLAYASLFRNILIDDTFITLVYARNIVEHFSWGFAAGEPMNTATSALNVAGLAATAMIARDPAKAVLIFSAAVWMATILALDRISRRFFKGHYFAAVCAAALLANPLLISTLGLESYLYILLFIGALDSHIRRRQRALAVILGLLTMTRFDGVLAAAIFLVFTPGWKRRARIGLIYTAVLIPWHLFAWIHLGSLLPDTLFIKTAQPGFESYEFFDGLLLYFAKYPLAMIASLVFAPAAVLTLFVRRRRVRRAGLIVALYGIAHYAGYSALRVPPYGWYYTSTLMCLILLAGLGLAELRSQSRNGFVFRALSGIPMVPVLLMAAIFFSKGFPLTEMPVHSNWATCAQYAAVADQLAALTSPGEPILCHAEIGTLAYFGRLNLRNEFSDRSILNETVGKALKRPAARLLAGVNFYWRQIPPPQPMTYGIVFNIATNEALYWTLGTSWMESSTLYFQKIARD